MSKADKIAHAYGKLVARGEKATVRAVQREAGVSIGEVAAWLREHASSAAGDTPESPDLSEPMSALTQSVWAAAWVHAAKQADQAAATALASARAGEAEALAAAEQADTDKAEAIRARDHATSELEALRAQMAQLQSQLDAAQQALVTAQDGATRADRARVRAEAVSDTLREVMDRLRAENTTSEAATPEQGPGRKSD
ncbi:MAG: hypothetical protein DI630_24345 [Gordonia sp. (in: high G+C Gram-positive bacteria)]|nr:MAG: hypothetical protein DI630_24345 [Gordonia sp. (in: high G+C Gram-positive bacteria)]